jgi:hypothetical protein
MGHFKNNFKLRKNIFSNIFIILKMSRYFQDILRIVKTRQVIRKLKKVLKIHGPTPPI